MGNNERLAERGWRAKGPASTQSDFPNPAGVPFYYFEVEILNGPEKDGEGEDEGGVSNDYVRIGFDEKHSPATATASTPSAMETMVSCTSASTTIEWKDDEWN